MRTIDLLSAQTSAEPRDQVEQLGCLPQGQLTVAPGEGVFRFGQRFESFDAEHVPIVRRGTAV